MTHPAKFSEPLYAVFNEMLPDAGAILDPFAGVGGVHKLATATRTTVGVEIEPEWAEQHPDTLTDDALDLPFMPATFDAICTSPTYGNRMADTYKGDGTQRHTYTIALGRGLSPGNSGAMQWGDEYRAFHLEAWAEALRVLRPDGVFVLNVKDHIRKGVRQHVAGWHIGALQQLGMSVCDIVAVPLKGNRMGANGNVRADAELVIKFQR